MRSSDLIYLDQAATSFPKPPAVFPALVRALTEAGGNPGRSGHRLSLAAAEEIYACRLAVASFFEAPAAEGVIFTANATAALNLAIACLCAKGGHVLISDMEHNAVFRPIYRLAEEGKITYGIYPTAQNVTAAIRARLRPDTVLVIANHASNICGRVLPLEEIGSLCREKGLCFLVDASQSAGHIPVSMRKMKIDILCAPAHKGLYGIQGAGIAVFAEERPYPPFLSGGSGAYSLSPHMPDEYPERFEAGTLPTPAIFALHAGLGAVKLRGVDAVFRHTLRLSALLTEELTALPGVRLMLPEEAGSGILSFLAEGFTPEELATLLDRASVCVRAGLHCAPLAHRALGTEKSGTVRISLGMTNTEEECLAFCRRLSAILKTKNR